MIKKFARQLRKNMMDAETILWYHLRNRCFENLKFRRQMPIGKYIVDFVCIEKHLIIELDGGQHCEQINYDKERTQHLNKMGYKVIRFWNSDIFKNLSVVLECIERHLKK